MASFYIRNLKELASFTRLLASGLEAMPGYPAILLTGPLGAGKTALVSSLVSRLPDGDKCEVASPSFNFCNIYPCRPPIMHCDLYRCKSAVPEDLLDALENSSLLTIIEWAQYLPENLKLLNYLDIHFDLEENIRRLEIRAQGALALELLESLSS